MTVALNSSFYH